MAYANSTPATKFSVSLPSGMNPFLSSSALSFFPGQSIYQAPKTSTSGNLYGGDTALTAPRTSNSPVGSYSYSPFVSAPKTTPKVIPQPSVTTSNMASAQTAANMQKFATVTQNINSQPTPTPTSNAPTGPDTSVPLPIPKYGDPVYDNSGKLVGTAKYDPNTGKALTDTPGATTSTTTTTKPTITLPDLVAANNSISDDAKKNIASLEALKKTMDATSNAIIAQIQAKYASLATQMTEKNQQVYNGLNNVGIVSGRSRYAPELQSGIMSNELAQGQTRLNDLENEKMGLVLQAQAAKDANSFKALDAISRAYDAAHAAQAEALQNMFDNSIKLENLAINQSQEKRATKESTYTDLQNLATTDLSSIDPSTYSQFDEQLGMPPGFSEKYVQAAYQAQQAQNLKDQSAANKAYIDMLQAIPAGKTMQMPDGSTYTGLGDANDLVTFEKENAAGKVTVVTLDKRTGDMKEYSAGYIGTPSSDGGGGSGLTDVTKAMMTIPRDADGFIKAGVDANGNTISPAQVYRNMMDAYTTANPGKSKTFTDNFNTSYWLDPGERGKFQ